MFALVLPLSDVFLRCEKYRLYHRLSDAFYWQSKQNQKKRPNSLDSSMLLTFFKGRKTNTRTHAHLHRYTHIRYICITSSDIIFQMSVDDLLIFCNCRLYTDTLFATENVLYVTKNLQIFTPFSTRTWTIFV